MAKKKKQRSAAKQKAFSANPFSDLKGFAASGEEENRSAPAKEDKPVEVFGSFAEEMDLLGVTPLDQEGALGSDDDDIIELELADVVDEDGLTEDEQFLAAMTGLNVNFEDHFAQSDGARPQAVPRRMKQVKRGRLKPQAKLDLHGCVRSEVVPKVGAFLKNGSALGFETLLIVTGRGLHSEGGEPVLRNETERYLSVNPHGLIAEWGRATKEFGGEGALFVFLKK